MERVLINDLEKVRAQIVFLTTELKLGNKSTVDKMFKFFSDLYHIPKGQCVQRKHELFTKFGIINFSDVRIEKLSQGMK